MTEKTKRLLVLFIVFDVGLGLGLIGGYVINDITSRENPNTIQQIREELQQQQSLETFFEQQQREATTRRVEAGTGSAAPSTTESD